MVDPGGNRTRVRLLEKINSTGGRETRDGDVKM
jgi:hypothetical protein